MGSYGLFFCFSIHPDIARHTGWMQFSLLSDCHHSEIRNKNTDSSFSFRKWFPFLSRGRLLSRQIESLTNPFIFSFWKIYMSKFTFTDKGTLIALLRHIQVYCSNDEDSKFWILAENGSVSTLTSSIVFHWNTCKERKRLDRGKRTRLDSYKP